MTLERYVSTHDRERTVRQHKSQIRLRARLAEAGVGQVDVMSAH